MEALTMTATLSSPARSGNMKQYPAEERSASRHTDVPEGCTHAEYLAGAPLRIIIRRDAFRALKNSKHEVLRMVWFRGFDRGHNFDLGSLQNIFNIAMLRAQNRAGLLPTPLHTSFEKAMTEAVKEPKSFVWREDYIWVWRAVSADFYIMNEAERKVWGARVVAVRKVTQGKAVVGNTVEDIPQGMQEYKPKVDITTAEEVMDLQHVGNAGEVCSQWFQAALKEIINEDLMYYVPA